MSFDPIVPPVAAVPVAITFTGSSVSAPNLTAYTFASETLGTGKIVVAVSGGGDVYDVSTLTVDGNAATLIIAEDGTATDEYPAELWYYDGNTAATGDIVVTFTGGQAGCGIGVYLVENAALGAGSDSQSTADNTGDATPQTVTLNVPANGGVIAAYTHNGNAVRSTWSGVTERYDEVVDASGSDIGHTGGSLIYAAASPTQAVTCTPGGIHARKRLVAVAFGPA